ncbi:riboflavin synthase-like protein [Kalaharituber pfeilii]|nr:riboflavin synthase-like protein [Kalaharituber pfeilii]
MFTGIVEAIGTVTSLSQSPTTLETVLTISTPPPSPILTDAHLGDSISVNGTCLTIKSFTATTFVVGLAPETLRRTNLSSLTAGSKVNLERAIAGEVRFGGHYVQGHVDCVAEVIKTEMEGESKRMRFRPKGEGSKGIMRYIVEKGFVAVDGVSLTVTEVGGGGEGDQEREGEGEGEGWFGVMLVAYTQEKIVTSKKEVGETVNVEVDMVGKLVEKQIQAHFTGGAVNKVIEAIVENVVERKLKEAGIGK